MVLEVEDILRDVFTILKNRKVPITNLSNYNISRGMNAKIISEIIIYVYELNKKVTEGKASSNPLNVANISSEDLTIIYNNLSDKPEEDISKDAFLALKLTLGRYWRILEVKG